MATTIGRVEFIVGLDGNKLPAQARKLANQIAAAGTRSGKDFGDSFEASFSKSLTRIGDDFTKKLSDQGKLAANRFSTDFERVVSGRFQTMQRSLAEILSDKDAFTEFARGFDDVGDATRQLQADLDALVGQQTEWVDKNGEVVQGSVLARGEYQKFSAAIREFGREAETVIARERDLARQQEDLDASFRRLTRTIGDTDAFSKMSEEVGGTEVAYGRLRRELEGFAGATKASRGDLEEWVDTLDRTRESVDRTNTRLVEMEHQSDRVGTTWQKIAKLNPFSKLDNDVQLVIGIIASAADQVAVLGSAVGAGLVAVGGAVASLAIGAGAAFAVFSKLNDEIDSLPLSMRGVAASFQGFKQVLGDTGDAIAAAGFGELDGAFNDLSDTVSELTPGLSRVGAVVGDLGADLAKSIRPGTEMFEVLNDLVDNAAGNFDTLARSAGVLGGALLRSFDRAQPLVEDLLGWVDKLAKRFDTFSRSNDFTDWVSNAQRVWKAFGGTLDAVAGALSDLVTPAAVDRTVKLLDNVTRLAPQLGTLLDTIGGFDLIGNIVDVLADVGDALAPLQPGLASLFESLGVAVDAFSDATTVLEIFATAAGPVVSAVAGIAGAVPPEVWTALATGASVYAVALGGLKVVNLVTGGFTKLADLLGEMALNVAFGGKAFGDLGSKMSKFVGSAAGTATVIGAAAAGSLILVDAVKALTDSIVKIDEKTRKALSTNQSLVATVDELSGAAQGLSTPLTDVDTALNELNKWQGGNIFSNIAAVFTETGSGAHDLNAALNELDKGLQGLPLEEQADKFNAWATELGASDDQILAMLDSMPLYKKSLEDASKASGKVASDTDLITLAMGGMDGASGKNVKSLDDITSASGEATRSIQDLADTIRGYGDTQFAANAAARDYQAAIDDITASIAENGTTLDINTEAGRSNQEALDDLAQSALDNAAAIKENTGSQELANQAISAGRDELIKQLEQFGLTGDQAAAYADQLGLVAGKEGEAADKGAENRRSLQNTLESFGLTGAEAEIYAGKLENLPPDVDTLVELLNVDPSIKDAESLKKAIDNIQDKTVTIRVVGKGPDGQPIYQIPGGARFTARGGMFDTPQLRVISEAGPEAVVPLRRPLSQVDPAVRPLSAIAQGISNFGVGLTLPPATLGGRIVNIESGAVVVQGDRAPEATATTVVNRIAERISA